MSRRFFHPHLIRSGEAVELEESEAHHLIHVMRGQVGDPLVLFDGKGTESLASIETMTKKKVTVRVEKIERTSRELRRPLVVGCPVPKSDRQKFLIEKLTELGVTRFVPLQCDRSSVPALKKLLGKLERVVVESSKQCGRNHLMQIDPPVSVDEYCRVQAGGNGTFLKLIGDAAASSSVVDLWTDGVDLEGILILVGPEGGLTEDEKETAERSGFRRICVGPSVLRIETAAIALATVGVCRLGDPNPRS